MSGGAARAAGPCGVVRSPNGTAVRCRPRRGKRQGGRQHEAGEPTIISITARPARPTHMRQSGRRAPHDHNFFITGLAVEDVEADNFTWDGVRWWCLPSWTRSCRGGSRPGLSGTARRKRQQVRKELDLHDEPFLGRAHTAGPRHRNYSIRPSIRNKPN